MKRLKSWRIRIMASNEEPFKGFPKISELAKMLGKTTTTSDTIVRRWERSSTPPIPIKGIYVGSRAYEVNNGFTKKMTREKLLEKAREFKKKNKRVTWKPHDFPEDMSESSTLDELVSEGDNMYDALEEAVKLISDLADELEYKIEVED